MKNRERFNSLLKIKWPFIIISLLFSLNYLIWRGLYTLDHNSTIGFFISVTLYIAELYGFLAVLLFFFQTYKLKERYPIDLSNKKLPTVDILIPIYNEPEKILYNTLVACSYLDYPKELYRVTVCDDGKRESIRKMAEEFGFNYITRDTNEHAKAGNINNALKHTSNELVAILDCDHIPVRTFIKELVGFFIENEKLAYVQTPHHFYNPDSYQKNLRFEEELTHEQDLFFHVIQPGKDYWNSAIFAGSAAMFRRKVLDEIGGFRTEVAIEDLHTGMEIHSRGYESYFYNRILIGGLSPENFPSYLIQRSRWTRGGIQMFMLDNPLFKNGLTLPQRLSYFASIFYFFHSIPRLVYPYTV